MDEVFLRLQKPAADFLVTIRGIRGMVQRLRRQVRIRVGRVGRDVQIVRLIRVRYPVAIGVRRGVVEEPEYFVHIEMPAFMPDDLRHSLDASPDPSEGFAHVGRVGGCEGVRLN